MRCRNKIKVKTIGKNLKEQAPTVSLKFSVAKWQPWRKVKVLTKNVSLESRQWRQLKLWTMTWVYIMDNDDDVTKTWVSRGDNALNCVQWQESLVGIMTCVDNDKSLGWGQQSGSRVGTTKRVSGGDNNQVGKTTGWGQQCEPRLGTMI